MRPLHVVVGLYRKVDSGQAAAVCRVCGEGFAGQMHVADLKSVLNEVGLDWKLDGAIPHYADVCPKCRRRLFGANHEFIIGQRGNREDAWQN